jgi:uncharacterized protein DUF3768
MRPNGGPILSGRERATVLPQETEMMMTSNSDDSAAAQTPETAGGEDRQTRRIRDLNDRFRRSMRGGKVVMTRGVADFDPMRIAVLLDRVRGFDAFTPDNDPHREHDFGAFEEGGERFFWKIDYYDKEMAFGSSDATNPDVTTRVLTLMRADEY